MSLILPYRAYYHNSSRCAFKIELTKTTEPQNKQDVKYEIEFELIDWALSLHTDARNTWCAGLLTFVHSVMAGTSHCVVDESHFPPFEALYLRRESSVAAIAGVHLMPCADSVTAAVTDAALLVALRRTFLSQFGSTDANVINSAGRPEDFKGVRYAVNVYVCVFLCLSCLTRRAQVAFPGTMPRALRRAHLLPDSGVNLREFMVSGKVLITLCVFACVCSTEWRRHRENRWRTVLSHGVQ